MSSQTALDQKTLDEVIRRIVAVAQLARAKADIRLEGVYLEDLGGAGGF